MPSCRVLSLLGNNVALETPWLIHGNMVNEIWSFYKHDYEIYAPICFRSDSNPHFWQWYFCLKGQDVYLWKNLVWKMPLHKYLTLIVKQLCLYEFVCCPLYEVLHEDDHRIALGKPELAATGTRQTPLMSKRAAFSSVKLTKGWLHSLFVWYLSNIAECDKNVSHCYTVIISNIEHLNLNQITVTLQ